MTESDHTRLLKDEDFGQKTAMFNIIYNALNIHTNKHLINIIKHTSKL